MTSDDRTAEPRCTDCQCVLPAPGAICHACDVEAHFEGAVRTAPPMLMPQRAEALRQRSGRRAS